MIIERDYGLFQELKNKGVVSDKVKLGELKNLLKKERCPHN